MKTPFISIVMPVFNTGKYLDEAIRSLINQRSTYSDATTPSFEILIIDDHSTDSLTLSILEKCSTYDLRIKVIKNERSKGAAGARNTGILRSRGIWIGFLDSDDIWFPDSLSSRWDIITKNPDANWVAARFLLLKPDSKGDFNSPKDLSSDLNRSGKSSQNDITTTVLHKPLAAFSESCFIGIMTVLIKRDLILSKGMFDERLPRAEDYHLWIKCSLEHDLYVSNKAVAFYRIHDASLTHGSQPKYLYEDVMIQFLLEERRDHHINKLLLRRFDISLQEQCYFYRARGLFLPAFGAAIKWLLRRPARWGPYKEIAACLLRVS
jgi:glycosyltransferase involved in cell wall biosynthesis